MRKRGEWKVSNKRKLLEILKPMALLIIGVIFICPLYMVLIASLKDDRYVIMADFGSVRSFMITQPSLNNFVEILGPGSNTVRYFINSIIVLVGTVGGTVLVTSMCAYAVLRGKFKFRKMLLGFIIALYIIPYEAIMLPMLYEAVKLNLMDTYLIQILPFIAHPLYIYLFYTFFQEIPSSVIEAAKIDGLGFFKIYLKMFVPLTKPAFVTVMILQGMESWNQYLWPLLVTQTERVRPVTVAIASYFSSSEIYWDRLFAISTLMMLPVLSIYLFFQKYFIASVSNSGTKG